MYCTNCYLQECHQKSTKQRVPTGYNQPAIHLFNWSKDRECSLLSLVIFFRSWINNAESELKFKNPTKINILNPQSDWFVVQRSLNDPFCGDHKRSERMQMLRDFPYNSALLRVGNIMTPDFRGVVSQDVGAEATWNVGFGGSTVTWQRGSGGWTNQDFMGMGCFFWNCKGVYFPNHQEILAEQNLCKSVVVCFVLMYLPVFGGMLNMLLQPFRKTEMTHFLFVVL